MRQMWDAVDPTAIPADAVLVAGYLDGLNSRWPAEAWSWFPNATLVHIVVDPSNNAGEVLDVEYEDSTAVQSVDWTIMRRAAGLATPTIYCGRGEGGYTWQEVLAAHDARGIERPLIWLADYSHGPVIPDGCIAVQYANGPAMTGINADASVVADYWPGVDAPPLVPPDPGSGPDVPDAQGAIASARALLAPLVQYVPAVADADTFLEHSQEDLNSSMQAGRIPRPTPPIVTPTTTTWTPPPWLGFAIAVAMIVVPQLLLIIHAFPPGPYANIAAATVTAIGAILAGIQVILPQWTSHALQIEYARTQTTLAISGRKAG